MLLFRLPAELEGIGQILVITCSNSPGQIERRLFPFLFRSAGLCLYQPLGFKSVKTNFSQGYNIVPLRPPTSFCLLSPVRWSSY